MLKQHLAFAGAGFAHDRQRFAGSQIQIHFGNGAHHAFTGGEIHAQLARLEEVGRRSSQRSFGSSTSRSPSPR